MSARGFLGNSGQQKIIVTVEFVRLVSNKLAFVVNLHTTTSKQAAQNG
jgi:hypothetical protein